MTIAEAVNEVFARGGLEATAKGRRSLAIEGVSLAPIRWQAAICSLIYGADSSLPPRAAHLEPAIRGEIAKAQERRAAGRGENDGR